MSFIDDLRTVVAAFNNKDAAKIVSSIDDMGQERVGSAVIDAIASGYGGPIVPLINEGFRAAGEISDLKRWANDINNPDSKESGGTPTYIEGRRTVDDDNTPVEQKDTEDESKESNDYDIDEMAGEFILGAWGNGQDRIDNMINAGYSLDDYNKIQQRVNEAYESGRDLHEWTNKANEKLKYW